MTTREEVHGLFADGVIVIAEDAEVHALELVALDELGEAPATVVAVKADGAVGAVCVGVAAVELDELEGEMGAEVWQVQHLHEEGDIRGGPAVP
jgi:hypothetical protein